MPRPRLLFVHGRGQGEFDARDLLDLWLQSLSIGIGPKHEGVLKDADIDLPFYGARLDELLRDVAGLPKFPQRDRENSPQLREFEHFQHAHVREVQERHGLTDEKLEALGNRPGQAPEIRGLPWVHSILRALDKIPGLSGEMLERLTHDVWLYMRDGSVRSSINTIVEAALVPGSQVIVIGHSFGSVIAYDILRQRDDIRVPLFVTLGSPLGIHSIRSGFEPLCHPACVGKWLNAFDRRDLIAMYPLDPLTFPVDPPVINYDNVENRTTNAHGIFGYLSDPMVAGAILDALARRIE